MPHLVKSLFPDGRAPNVQVTADNFAGCIEAIISGGADAMICYSHKDIQTGDHVLDEVSSTLGSDRLIPVSCVQQGRAKFSLKDPSIPFLKYSNMSFLGRVTKLMLDKSESDLALVPVYEDSIAAALKSAALEGLGIAWLPEGLVKHELERGLLANISGGEADFEVPISVTVYRGRRPQTRSFERFWAALNL
ncbi:MAG: LysR substrate-binding domain-containing protein [Octadecabacter sp.]